MRRLVLAAGCVVLIASPAAAAWKNYRYPELGVAKEFTADPKWLETL